MDETRMEGNRDLLHLVSKHSNISTPDLEDAFETEGIYSDAEKWDKTLYFSLPGLGITFFVAGVVFFFAFNWVAIPAFAKFGIIGGLLIASVLVSYRVKERYEHISHILMALAFVLVGVLFAVFGQVYQTGADAYDLFIAWTLSVIVWTLISPYPVIWFLFAVLSNITLSFYYQQGSPNADPYAFPLLSVLLNIGLWCCFYFKTRYSHFSAKWLLYTLTGFIGYALTTAIIIDLFQDSNVNSNLAIYLIALLYFPAAIWYGNRRQEVFYIGSTALCLLIVLNAFLIKFFTKTLESDSFTALLLMFCVINIGATILIIKLIINLRKKWLHESITSTTDSSTDE